MNTVNLYEAKASLGKLVKEALNGKRTVICIRNRPAAQLIPIEAEVQPHKISFGKARDLFSVPEGFDAPLDGFEKDYYGE